MGEEPYNSGSNLGDLKRKIKGRFQVDLLGQIGATCAGAALIIILARILTPNSYGLLFLSISILSIIELLSRMGIPKSAARFLSEYKEKQPGQVVHILKISFKYLIIAIVSSSLILIIGHHHLASILDEPDIVRLLQLGILYLSLSTIFYYIRTTLQGFENIKEAAIIYAIDRILRLVFVIGLVLIGFGVLGALFGYIFSFLIASLVGGRYLLREYRGYSGLAEDIDEELRERIARYSIPLAVTHAAFLLDRRFDTVLIGYYLSSASVGFYVIAFQIIEFVEVPVKSLGYTLSPSFGAEKAADNIRNISRVFESALIYSLLIYTPAAAGLYFISGPLVEVVFGSEYMDSVPVIKIFSFYLILRSITRLTNNGIDYLGRAKTRSVALSFTSISNIILTFIFIPLWGISGAALATVITYTLYTIINMYVIYDEFVIRTEILIYKYTKVLIISLIMSMSIVGFTDNIESIWGLILVVFIGFLVWSIMSVLFGFLPYSEIKSMLSNILS